MKAFRVTGSFRMGRVLTPFTIEAIGKDAEAATGRVLSTLGSRHRVDRHHIGVAKAVEVPADQVTDPAVRKQLSLVK